MLRVRTSYSFKHAIGSLDNAISRLVEIGATAAPISDRLSTFGFTKWTKAARVAGLRPVYGVELGVVTELGQKKPAIDYWTFFAKESLQPLNELVALATSNPGKEPCLTYAQACADEGVIKIAGEACSLDAMIPENDVLMALSPATPKGLYRDAQRAGYKFVATSCNVYPRADDLELYRLALGRRANTQSYPQHILSDAEWSDAVAWMTTPAERKAALANRKTATAACTAVMKHGAMLKPVRPMPLKKMCEMGAKRLGVSLKDKIYRERLKSELELIESKNFADYFFIVADLIQWAKKRMIVGPARGSSCGSLVCYLLGITSIDPLKYDLLFERFLDITRTDFPDIDTDLSDAKRHLVFEYAEQTYGRERVAKLGTVGNYKAKSALNAVAQNLSIPEWRVDRVADLFPVRNEGDENANDVLRDTLSTTDVGVSLAYDYPAVIHAQSLEGLPANAGQHAAGLVITHEPITNYLAVDSRVGAVMCDKRDAEKLDLLKIDALGLTQLSVFERCLELIGEKPVNGYLEKLPLDDRAAFDVLNTHRFAGIFQFSGMALQRLVHTLGVQITTLDDMIGLTALARPGPMESGGAAHWIDRRNGKRQVAYPHPAFEPFLSETLGVIVYQEQVMKICREIGGMSWADVTGVRKAMAKSLGKEALGKFGDAFSAGATANGIPQDVIEKVWDDLCKYGRYGFNKSHSVAYGIVSYWCCYLKAHHPVEFAAATLDAETDPDKQIDLLRELALEGVDYVAVDLQHSTDRWQPIIRDGKTLLVGPVGQIKGVGPAAVKEIMSARKNGDALRPGLAKKLAPPKTKIDTLFPVRDRIAALHPDLKAINIISPVVPVKQVQCRNDEYPVMIIGVLKKLTQKDENEPTTAAKRGYPYSGPHIAVNMFFADDTDRIFCKISRKDYGRIAKDVLARGGVDKSLYAVKGRSMPFFRMIFVDQIKYLGELE